MECKFNLVLLCTPLMLIVKTFLETAEAKIKCGFVYVNNINNNN